MASVVMLRHQSVRRRSTWQADVPLYIIGDLRYFDEDGRPTSLFDQWMCDNGTVHDVTDDVADEDDLAYEVDDIGAIVWPERFDA